jgi:protein-arginine deiminase
MRRHLQGLLAVGATVAFAAGIAPAAHATPGPFADLRADFLGTGDVTVTGPAAGNRPAALFLANIDDDQGRCKAPARKIVADAVPRESAESDAFYAKKAELEKDPDKAAAEAEYEQLARDYQKQLNKADRELAACNDAADTVVNGPQDAKDLARLRTVPWPDAPAGAQGRVIMSAADASRVHLFVRRPGSPAPLGWELLGPDTVLTAAELRHGVELGIEGRDVIRDAAVWNGHVDVTLSVTAGGSTRTSTVTMKEAPVLTQLNTRPLNEVLAQKPLNDPELATWEGDVATAARQTGATGALRTVTTDDAWMQDIFEPGYASIPGPDGAPQGMRVLINSVNDDRRVGSRITYTDLVGRDVAAVHTEHVPTPDEDRDFDSMGDVETVPPTPGHPLGTIITGGDGFRPGPKGPAPEMLTLLRSQDAQRVVSLDTSWLSVGHVDEVVQFLPAPGSRLGWRAVVADPAAGVALLRQAQQQGHGALPLHMNMPKLDWPYDEHVDTRTIDAFLADGQFTDTNRIAAEHIAADIAVLKAKTGMTDADIIRVPELFSPRGSLDYQLLESEIAGMDPGPDRDKAQAQLAAMRQSAAEIPNAVNGLVLGQGRFVAPKPYGPSIDGTDIFAQAISQAYARAGYQVQYEDDLTSAHFGEGEIHCMTNTLRDVLAPDQRWWRTLR